MSDNLIHIARNRFAQAVFNSAIHQECKSLIISKVNLNKKINLTISVILTLFVLCLQFWVASDNFWSKIINLVGVILTVVQVCYSFYQIQFDETDKIYLHRKTADQYRELRDDYSSLISQIFDVDNTITYEHLELLQTKYNLISNNAPDTNNKAYMAAQNRLGTTSLPNQGIYSWSDEEINSFLPVNLQYSPPQSKV